MKKEENGNIVHGQSQDYHIRRRINKLFFLRKLEYLKKQTPFVF